MNASDKRGSNILQGNSVSDGGRWIDEFQMRERDMSIHMTENWQRFKFSNVFNGKGVTLFTLYNLYANVLGCRSTTVYTTILKSGNIMKAW
jgi:hypothetical protein